MQDASRVPNLGLRVPNPRKHPVYTHTYRLTGAYLNPIFVLQFHETCENVVRNAKKSSKTAPRKAHRNGVQLHTRKMK